MQKKVKIYDEKIEEMQKNETKINEKLSSLTKKNTDLNEFIKNQANEIENLKVKLILKVLNLVTRETNLVF